jgi:DNA-3-methyladenine glycosylase I
MRELNRCSWPDWKDGLMIRYHDEEWGVPVHDDRLLFEYMVLDAFQAGLSWKTILSRRENFRKAFDNFEPAAVANYDEQKRQELLKDPGIIRNRAKIDATISNARQFLIIQKDFGSFDRYIWSFTSHKTIRNRWKNLKELPASSDVSDRMSNDLRKRGFKFAGTKICYAFMQAAGMVNDHTVDCFRYGEVGEY